jgi:uncharacterized repeat protein (TIGR01451 family)
MTTRLFFRVLSCLALLLLYGSSQVTPPLFSALPHQWETGALAVASQPTPDDDDESHWRAWQALDPLVQAKVDPRILAELRGEVRPAHLGGTPGQTTILPADRIPLAQTRFLLYLQKQADFSAVQTMVFASAAERRNAVVELLRGQAQEQQAALRGWLDGRLGTTAVAGYQPFTIVNAIAVEGDLTTIITLAQRADVARLVANYPLVSLWQEPVTPGTETVQAAAVTLDANNWNIALVGADRVWTELGVRGAGAVVAGFDTGVAFRHPALFKQYRGNLQNGRVDHNYNWFEPDGKLYANGALGPSRSRQPFDCHGHGTHTMGTSVGDGGSSGTQIGMAPGAKWIALPGICAGTMAGGIQDDIGGLKAFQWLLCPTDLTGNPATADCSKAPDVVNNSWGSANPTNEVLRPAIAALRAVNIAPVFAAGNPRAGDGSIGSPGNAPEAITVGATDRLDLVAPFSGRGPSFYEGEQKPEVSAPGVDVLSSLGDSSYDTNSGTSMAAPHVAGLIALMVAADLRDGRRDFTVDELETFMTNTAIDLGEAGPDNDYGYGRINAYEAVRWVLSAGDLRGLVRSQGDNTPLAGATVTGVGNGTTFHGLSNGGGAYSVTVPAGYYDLTVTAWGYYSSTFSGQTVLAGALAQANFALRPLPTAVVQGSVRSGGTPVVNALLTVAAQPALTTRTDANGQYRLSLPTGQHTLVVKENGYRRQQALVTVDNSGASQDFALESAPSILLVEADAYRGWFEGWPIGKIFTWALDQQGYSYDRWPIQYVNITDTKEITTGVLGYGVPSTTTLQGYDVVIWAQSGCDSGFFGCLYRSSPTKIGADDSLRGFMDSGGRLILSGQDIGTWDDGTLFYDQYLNANQVMENAAEEGHTITGSGFLDSLTLTVTNASLYGYRNGAIALSPDAVEAERYDDATYPILRYDQSQAPAALAIDSCHAGYRAVYFAVGFENIGPRADNRDPAIAEVLGRTVRWVSSPKTTRGLEIVTTRTNSEIEPGETTTYALQLVNTGQAALTLALTVDGGNWGVELLQGGQPINGPLTLGPCQAQELTVALTAPATALNGELNTLRLTATAVDDATLTRQVSFKTLLFASWGVQPAMPDARYSGGVAAAPTGSHLYIVGGWRNDLAGSFTMTERAAKTLLRYNVCNRQVEPLADLPGPRANMTAVLLQNKLYVVGGSSLLAGFDFFEYTQYATLLIYDPATNQWSEGAALPTAYAGMAVAAANGKLYAFGGIDAIGNSSARGFEYDPASNRWRELAPMPDGPRYQAAAATLQGQLYVVGGREDRAEVAIYDPATNRWQNGPKLRLGRHSLGLTAAPDGYLYAVGGAIFSRGEASVERYSPTASPTRGWEVLSSLNDPARQGVGTAYAAGQLFAVGGAGVLWNVESLRIESSFCLSEQRSPVTAIGIGNPITYSVALYADTVARPNASYRHPLPPKSTFGGFVENNIGARFNATSQQVEWQGALGANANPLALRYLLNTDSATISDRERLTSTAYFSNGADLLFTRTTVNLLLAADLSNSTKSVDQRDALAGAPLTYTIQLLGATFVGGDVAVRDPLPSTLEYISGTLRYDSGVGSYDPATHSILWQGQAKGAPDAYINSTDDYVLGDSNGGGTIPNVRYEWLEIGTTGVALDGGDFGYLCDLPIGFAFPFYDTVQNSFCVSTNGFISFQTTGTADDTNDCPLPSDRSAGALIAAMWDDLVVEKDIRYQLLGAAPNRSLVVQWNGARRYGSASSKLATFQVVLFENGVIRVAIKTSGNLQGAASTTGIENGEETRGLTYACNELTSLRDQQAILFVPPGASFGVSQAALHFQARSLPTLGANVGITNTVFITTIKSAFQRQATTVVNPVRLQSSTAQVTPGEVAPGGTVVYSAQLSNTGLFTATNANLTFAIPTAMSYVDGTLACSAGLCQPENGALRWRGVLAPDQTTAVTFTLRLTTGLPDQSLVALTGQLEDGFGQSYPLTAIVVARRSDLRQVQLQILPAYVAPGANTAVNLLVYNAGGVQTNATVQMNIPAPLTYVADSLTCGDGACSYANGAIQWSGLVGERTLIPIRLRVQTPANANYGDRYPLTATFLDQEWQESYNLQATLTIARNYGFPIVRRPEQRYRLFLPVAPNVKTAD